MYVTVHELKQLYRILLPDALVFKALKIAHEFFIQKTSVKYSQEIQKKDDTDEYEVTIPTGKYLVDADYTWTATTTDLKVFQFNVQDRNEEEISDKITAVRTYRRGGANSIFVTFSEDVPTGTFDKLAFEFQITHLDISQGKYQTFMKDYIGLFALKHLLVTADVDKLQTGIATWNFSGTDVSVDANTVEQVIEMIEKQLVNLYNDFVPMYTATFVGNVDDSARYFGHRENSLRTFYNNIGRG